MSDKVCEYLRQQRDLSAVERFSEAHEAGALPHQAKYYKSLLPASAPAAGEQYAFEVDLDRCSGCKACVTACHNLNGLDETETWRAVGLLDGRSGPAAAPAAPAWKSGALVARPVADVDTPSLEAPRFYHQHVTAACHHCADPACLNGCPVKAYDKSAATGIVKHLDDQCIGCQYCTYMCPYGVPQYNPRRGIVRKCDMCSGRLSAGEAPACVQACPNEAIRITLVKTKDAGKDFPLPGAPAADFTKPTTRYVTKRGFPPEAQPQDRGVLQPQHAEWPLVFMLVLTQASVGAFAALPFFSGDAFRWGALAAAVAAHAGLALATLHLGRPLFAYRVVLGLKTSWLSREAVVFGLFAGPATLAAALPWLPTLLERLPFALPFAIPAPVLDPRLPRLFAAASVLPGLAGVWCSAKIYMATPRAWWASPSTAAKFFLTAANLGPALLAAAGAGHPALFLFAVAAGIAKGVVEAGILKHKKDGLSTALGRTALLLTGHFKTLFQLRGALGISSLFFLGAACVLRSWPVAVVGFLLRLGAEILERHLFFRAVAPPRMPGNA